GVLERFLAALLAIFVLLALLDLDQRLGAGQLAAGGRWADHDLDRDLAVDGVAQRLHALLHLLGGELVVEAERELGRVPREHARLVQRADQDRVGDLLEQRVERVGRGSLSRGGRGRSSRRSRGTRARLAATAAAALLDARLERFELGH